MYSTLLQGSHSFWASEAKTAEEQRQKLKEVRRSRFTMHLESNLTLRTPRVMEETEGFEMCLSQLLQRGAREEEDEWTSGIHELWRWNGRRPTEQIDGSSADSLPARKNLCQQWHVSVFANICRSRTVYRSPCKLACSQECLNLPQLWRTFVVYSLQISNAFSSYQSILSFSVISIFPHQRFSPYHSLFELYPKPRHTQFGRAQRSYINY